MPCSHTHFRRLHPTDTTALAAFFEELVASGAEAVFHPHPLTPAHAERLCRHQLREDGGDVDEYLVAVEDGRIVAYGLLRGWSEGYDVPSLGIAVRPCCRGRGLARRFMDRLHDVALARGATAIRLTVYRDNTPALRLYESLGYELSPHSEAEWLGRLHLGQAPGQASRAA